MPCFRFKMWWMTQRMGSSGRDIPVETQFLIVESAAGANFLARAPIAASVNLTATRHETNGFVTAWSCGDRPSTSALNPAAEIGRASCRERVCQYV